MKGTWKNIFLRAPLILPDIVTYGILLGISAIDNILVQLH